MQYKNFERVKHLCQKIDHLVGLLNTITEDTTVVVLKNNLSNTVIQTIGPGKRWEHKYSPLAEEFISKIKNDIWQEIAELEKELDAL
jgi:hypothetical protein